MAKDEIAISVKNVKKSFKLPHEKHDSIKSIFLKGFRRKKSFEKQRVLKGVSFEIKKGEFYGIVGRNGSGKSTLLKLLAGIYTPDSGSITINGKLTPFIELGVGFNPELTGRENVFLNGALLGFSRSEMEKMYDEIVEFAELEKFMDQKLKNYSSGMQVRLAFSIAIRAQTAILLLDEVLAVGDSNFQQKCLNYFKRLKKEKRTVILVTHDMNTVRNYCTKALLISDGNVVKIGNPVGIINEYDRINMKYLETEVKGTSSADDELLKFGTGDAEVVDVLTLKNSKKSDWFGPKDDIAIKLKFSTKVMLESPVVGVTLTDAQGLCVFATNTLDKGTDLGTVRAHDTFEIEFKIPPSITDGEYSISCALANSDRSIIFARVENAHKFSVTGWTMPHSMFHPKYTIKIGK